MGQKSLRDRKIPIDRLVVSSCKGAIKSRKNPDYDNSSKLRKINPDKYPGVTGCCGSLLAAMRRIKRFFPLRPTFVLKLQHHVEFFVVNLYHVYQQDPSRWVSYSRNKNEYGKKSEYKDKFKLSHDYSVNKVVKFLLDHLYIEHSPFIHIKGDTLNSRQSRIRSTPKLIDLITQNRKHEGSGDEQGEEDDWDDYQGNETIVVKGLKPRAKKITWMEAGRKRTKTIHRKRKICKTPDTPYVRRLREKVQVINSIMDKTEITLNVPPEDLKRLNDLLSGDGNNAVIDFTRKRLHRVFLDRRLDRGGRFYGPWYQGIPKEFRERILINGSPVCEPDFSGYHPRMLYAMKGVPLPEDPYRLEGYPETEGMRSFLKPLLLMIVNAKDEQSAIAGMRQKLSKDKKKAERWGRNIVPLEVEIRTDAQYRKVMGKLMRRHEPIKEFFYSSMGSYLQNLDSQIAEAVMIFFAHHFRQAVLPVHDSFIVDHRLVDVLEELMTQLTEKALGLMLPVKEGMGGVKKHIDLATRLAGRKFNPFDDIFIETFKDNPQREELLCSLKTEAKARVDQTRSR